MVNFSYVAVITLTLISLSSAALLVPDTNGIEYYKYPFLVSIRCELKVLNEIVHVCAGIIVAEKWIVTTASCLKRFEATDLIIYAGTNGTFDENALANAQVHHGKNIKSPKEIKKGLSPREADSIGNIAVLEIVDKFTFNKKVQPISLSDEEINENSLVYAAAWQSLFVAEFIEMTTVSKDDYVKKFEKEYGPINESLVAELINVHRHYLLMLGGPLLLKDKLAGLYTFGKIVSTEKPSVFTRISAYRSWLREATGIKNL